MESEFIKNKRQTHDLNRSNLQMGNAVDRGCDREQK